MLDKFKHHLKQAGQSVTAPRLAVFAYLQANDPAATRDIIRQLAPDIDRASIYRTLDLFRRTGVIQDIVTGGQRKIELTDVFDSHHHHLTCLRCGTIRTIDDPAVERGLDAVAARYGFEATSHQIEVSGVCARCQQLAQD